MIPIVAILVTLVVKFAMHPLRTLLKVLRALFFVFAVGMWILFFIMRAELDRPVVPEDYVLPVLFTIPWLLTFIPVRKRTRTE
ncbi:hypothetical protein [Flaviflexus huanghaiensis]|uniref:hypothetical protein n=1 Tax=Flaviflexus huanghaiensis TaxID=1111473 RepID=UPI0015FB782F|nr:hypothetical protein [Flaviflexus huanghaiensis]